MENELLKSARKVYQSDILTVYAADEVFVTVIGMAAADVAGVLSLSDLSTGELCLKPTVKNLSKCVRLDAADGQLTALIGIVVVAGDNLLGVSTKVQRKVLAAVKDIIGCDLSRVNIQISDVRSK